MFSQRKKKPHVLIVMDGWGIAPSWGGNAISQAKTPVFDKVWQNFPSTSLLASGEAVGLPANSPGNSEAGHLNLGAGHVVHQDISLIDIQINDRSFFKNSKILKAIEHARRNDSNLHLIGLMSKTGTHSHLRHLYALLLMIKANNFDRVFIHLISDGRDSDPTSGMEMAEEVEEFIREKGIGKIVSLAGRFYAMDRDNRWGRVSRYYNLVTKNEGEVFPSAVQALSTSYSRGVTDEFIEPCLIASETSQKIPIEDTDGIIVFNFRGDRVREITRAFLDENLPQFPDRKKLNNLYFATFVIYDDHLLSEQVFSPEKIPHPLAKVIAEHGLTQFHIAETEKYPHITYFFNGGGEALFPGEKRLLIPSPRQFNTYDRIPQMSAEEVTVNLVKAIRSGLFDFLVVNFANADMVGHTGNLAAAMQAVEVVDSSVGRVLDAVMTMGGVAIITADHGNAEEMVNPQTGEPDTEHTTNPVPMCIVSPDEKIRHFKLLTDGILGSVAPTLLDLMSVPKPEEMPLSSLIIKENVINVAPSVFAS